jgi:putative transposase
VAFVINVFARPIVGWPVSPSMTTAFVVDAGEQARYARRSGNDGTLIHHSDRGPQYVSVGDSERLPRAGIEPSVGSRRGRYDNTLTETINGLYKAELIHRRAPWKTRESIELATLEQVARFNRYRPIEPLGYISPAEAGQTLLPATRQYLCCAGTDLNLADSTITGGDLTEILYFNSRMRMSLST